MSYTQQDILDKIAKRVDYSEIARILELDLNTIAMEIVTDPSQYLQFKVFLDYDEFDTTVEMQAPGEGQGFLITPVMLNLVNGSYTTQKGPQVYQTEFRIEVLALEKDIPNVRAVLEVFSSLNQGTVSNNMFANALTTSITDFPVVTDPFPYKGFTRVDFYLSWLLTFIYSGQLANEVEIYVDDELLDIQGLTITRSRIGDTIQRNDQQESTTINKSQILNFSGSLIYDSSDSAKKILRNIKNKDSLQEKFELRIKYTTIYKPDTILTDIEWVASDYFVSNEFTRYYGSASDLVADQPDSVDVNGILEPYTITYLGDTVTPYDYTLTIINPTIPQISDVYKALYNQLSLWYNNPTLPITVRVDNGLGYYYFLIEANQYYNALDPHFGRQYFIALELQEIIPGEQEEDTYTVTITEGDIILIAGGYLNMNFSMNLSE